MKNRLFVLMTVFAVTVPLLFSCSGKKDSDAAKMRESMQTMTREELIEAAKKEGKLVVYSTTSRVSLAAENFEKLYGIKVETANLKDGELVKKVSLEVSGKVAGADMVLCQDGARVYGELINLGYLVNYVPFSLADQIPPENQNPLVFQFCDKIFVFNSEKSEEPPVTNIWQLTEPEWKGRIQFKNPPQEGVNSNFLTMLTSDKWAAKIAQAYKDYYGKEIVLTTENAGYEWMKGFFNNAVLGTSDSNIAENVGTKGQKEQLMGLFVLSKLRYAAKKNLALAPIKEMQPFSGFYYPIYAQLTANAQNINAAKLFIEYLLTEEGFAPWKSDIGSYSGNPQVPCNEADEDINFWAARLVREEPRYSYENRAKVEEFVNNLIN
ncbi:ABC transporter substrate-binding protein [Treponema sp. HNW]|uniref:ABC transporter substrate-binding protein n=1 Tax=Treponema sp. HNW TaxID=3116654 RepID=UPI003D12AB9D